MEEDLRAPSAMLRDHEWFCNLQYRTEVNPKSKLLSATKHFAPLPQCRNLVGEAAAPSAPFADKDSPKRCPLKRC